VYPDFKHPQLVFFPSKNHIQHPNKNMQNNSSVYFNSYIFLTADGKTQESEVNGSKHSSKLKLL
jgi:hypothetical protein